MNPSSNNKIPFKFIILLVFISAYLAIVLSSGYADISATLTYFKGAVQVHRSTKKNWMNAETNMPLYVKDRVKTGIKSSAEILLDDGSIVRLKEKSLLEITELEKKEGKRKAGFGGILGKAWIDVAPQPPGSKFEMRGSTAVVGVRGTMFAVSVDSEQLMRVLVFDGSVEITTIRKKLEEVQSMILGANHALNITASQMSKPEPIKNEEKEDWNKFIKEIEQEKKKTTEEKPAEKGKEIKYSIKAVNVDGKEKETEKYSVPVKSTTGGETQ